MKNKKIQKFISLLLIISIIAPTVLFSRPQKADAFLGISDVTIDSIANILKDIGGAIYEAGAFAVQQVGVASEYLQGAIASDEWYMKLYGIVLQAIAQRALQEITKSTVNWINRGFHGSPLFLENSSSFFQDIVKSEVKTIVDQYGYDTKKFPFGKDFALNTIKAYRSGPLEGTQYTLSTAIKDPVYLSNFQNNFNVGGWNGFLINTQYPQNNYLGFQMLANEELARRISSSPEINNEITKVKETLQQGQGFLSPQTCADPGTKYNDKMANAFQRPAFNEAEYRKNFPFNCGNYDDDPETYQSCSDAWYHDYNKSKEDWAKDNTCKNLVATTPGSVTASMISKALGVKQDQVTLANAFGNSISTILGAVIDKFLNDGLSSLASTSNQKPQEDTWTYGGESLDGNVGANSDPFDGFDEVVILKDFKKLLNGEFIGTCSNIKDSGSERLPNQEDISETNCKDQSVSFDIGICTLPVENFSDTPVKKVGVSKTECKGTWVTSGNTTIWTQTGYIPGAIVNTDAEIKLMDNPPCNPSDPTCNDTNPQNPNNTATKNKDTTSPYYYNPGLLQVVVPILQKTKSIDQCLPGPDKGWETRLTDERDINISKFGLKKGQDNDPLKTRAANSGMRDLRFAVDSFKNWLITKMATSLPGAITYMDAITSIDDYSQELKQTVDTVRAKNQTLARLKAIAKSLETFTEQPKPNTGLEKSLISLKKQYNAIKSSISSTVTMEDTRNKLNTFKDKLVSVQGLDTECAAERTATGWTKEKELAQLCTIPIVSGYSHGAVVRNDESARLNNCFPTPENCNDANWDTTGWFTFRNPNVDHNITTPNGPVDPQQADFGNPGYEDLPMVNAHEVFGDNGGGVDRVSVQIDCKIIFRANPLDYTNAGGVSL